MIKTYLRGANLAHAHLPSADAGSADLRFADLQNTSLGFIDLSGARLHWANLNQANMEHANLHEAILLGANLRYANLQYANLSQADLSGADLTGADLRYAILSDTRLNGVNLTQAQFGGTLLGTHDLRVVKGLETIQHHSPSSLDINTLYLSQGNLPEVFVLGTGAPESFLLLLQNITEQCSKRPEPFSEPESHSPQKWKQLLELPRLVAQPGRADIEQEIEHEIFFAALDSKRRGHAQAECEVQIAFYAVDYAEEHQYPLFYEPALEITRSILQEVYGG